MPSSTPAPRRPSATRPAPIAGALAFELVSGGQRIIVNCGRPARDDNEARVFRTTTAHSTLTFVTRTAANTNRTKLQARLTGGPREVTAERQNAETGVLLEMSHEGYSAELGRRHVRSLYLQDGDLRGEDRIEPVDGAPLVPAIPYRLRFHIHPDIEVKPEDAGARLTLPNGEMWRFRCRGSEVTIADSIFNGPRWRAGDQAARDQGRFDPRSRESRVGIPSRARGANHAVRGVVFGPYLAGGGCSC